MLPNSNAEGLFDHSYIFSKLFLKASLVWLAKEEGLLDYSENSDHSITRQSFKQDDNMYCLDKAQLNKLNVYLQFKLNYDFCYTYESCLYIFAIIKLNLRNFLAITLLCYIYISFVAILICDK
jgi:hypothetical protein